ncbi:Origin recognition complex subunit 2 [Labeo rohita]|uniref:Origin recognition complex subunit 2 n=1 Tax=Labeo rohita TaxID=84645 RepID=A0ABQ8LAS4_LABRO|nr:Origin recognition complex subunit 2 [Labeo rohita]
MKKQDIRFKTNSRFILLRQYFRAHSSAEVLSRSRQSDLNR